MLSSMSLPLVLGWEEARWWPRLELEDRRGVRYMVGRHPSWVCSLCLREPQSWCGPRRGGEASGSARKHEWPQPSDCGKSPSEPPVNLYARVALLCQSHWPCMSRGRRRHRSQPPHGPTSPHPCCYRDVTAPIAGWSLAEHPRSSMHPDGTCSLPCGTWDGDKPWLGTKGRRLQAPTCRQPLAWPFA